jgi:hypothetical protein
MMEANAVRIAVYVIIGGIFFASSTLVCINATITGIERLKHRAIIQNNVLESWVLIAHLCLEVSNHHHK